VFVPNPAWGCFPCGQWVIVHKRLLLLLLLGVQSVDVPGDELAGGRAGGVPGG